jgi:hypothetical protein
MSFADLENWYKKPNKDFDVDRWRIFSGIINNNFKQSSSSVFVMIAHHKLFIKKANDELGKI